MFELLEEPEEELSEFVEPEELSELEELDELEESEECEECEEPEPDREEPEELVELDSYAANKSVMQDTGSAEINFADVSAGLTNQLARSDKSMPTH